MTSDIGQFVEQAFEPLTERYQLRLANVEHLGTNAWHARLETATVGIDIWHDPRCEVLLYMSRTGGYRSSLDDLLHFVNAPDAQRYAGIYSSDRESAAAVLERMFEALGRYGDPWLSGGSAPYVALAAFAGARNALKTQPATREVRPASTWRGLERAWEQRDYRSLLTRLEALSPPTTSFERTLIEYAKSQLRGSNEPRAT